MREKGISPHTVESVYQGQEVLTAINTLSTHTKLKRLGIADKGRVEPSLEARKTLAGFLGQLEKVVHRIEEEENEPLIGVSPRFDQLARSFVAARRDEKRKWSSDLVASPISETIRLMRSSNEEDQSEITVHLSDLRVLVEEHIATDTRQIFTQI